MNKLIILLSISILNSCVSDSEEFQKELIVGTWSNTSIINNSDLNQSLRYAFDSNDTFKVSRVVIDNATSEILGYRYRGFGRYSINGNQLVLHLLEIYTHDDSTGLYSDIDDLEFSSDSIVESVNFSINSTRDILTFNYPPCGPNANCMDSQFFEKID